MDPLTHTLLGASLGYVAFEKQLGRTAALAGGLAALVPDADVFIRSTTDPLLAIEYHRHFTHALLFAPIGAALVTLLWVWRRTWRPQALNLWLCCLLAYLSHCLLDAATSYGTQLWWPFTRHRFGWDLISIIDPVFTLALAVGLGLALKRRKIRPAGIALVFASAYLAFGAVQHSRAATVQRQLAASRGHTIERFEIMPSLANNLVWRALYVYRRDIFSDRIRVGWFSRATILEGWSLPLATSAELSEVERARNQRRSFERFYWFSEGWVARQPSDATLLGDMRYSLSTGAFDPIWGIRFTPPGSVAEAEWVNQSRNRRISATELWNEISGGDTRYQPLATVAAASALK